MRIDLFEFIIKNLTFEAMKLRSLLFTLVSLFGILPAYSMIEGGQIYIITNHGTPTVSMAANSAGNKAVAFTTDEKDAHQQWYIVGDSEKGYYFRNVATGAYLSSPNLTSQQWTLEYVTLPVDASMLMSISDIGEAKAIHVKKDNFGYGFAHKDASNNVVGWTTSAANTLWDFKNLNFTEGEIENILNNFSAIADEMARAGEYETILDRLFTDKTCSELKAGIILENNEDFNALSVPLQQMVTKINSGDWEEKCPYNGTDYNWEDKYARKYRLQLYEPYSEGSNGASMVGIQAYTNMNNPTGIVADKDDLLYVMVEEEPLPGATLYISGISDTTYHNSVTDGIKLHKGLNIIHCSQDNTHYFIFYSVATVKNKVPTEYRLADFPDLKIHIEGGRINGFFNYVGDSLYGKDTREELEYTVMRATFPMYDMIGKYVILHMHLEDTPSQEGEALQKCLKSALITNPTSGSDRTRDPVLIMQSWDNMCFSERILMGLQSDSDIEDAFNLGYYESIVGDNHSVTDGVTTYNTDPGFHFNDYFNNKMMGISQQGTLFMNATSWRTAYNVSTIDAILTLFPSGNIWGPAHEYGHMNQPPMNMAGTTEVSNNIFSNVAMYYAGLYSSRCEFPSAQLKNFQEGKTYLEAGTWGTTRMFWQLWCYYHATGHNKKFYPRLYQLLRQYPLVKTVASSGNHNERYDMLHFAKMCCIAAEEDLTNFFTIWGFFVPLENYEINDYSVYNAYLTEEDIQAVKDEIKAFNFPKNDAIILIDDRPGSTKTSYPDFPISKAGDLGGLKDFDSQTGVSPSGNYDFIIEGTTVSINRGEEKGVGYIIYADNGDILGFYNTDNFEVTPEIAEMLKNGTAIIEVKGESRDSGLTVTNTLLEGSPEKKREYLSDIVSKCELLLEDMDETDTKVGYLHSSSCSDILSLRDEAQSLIDSESTDGETLTNMINELLTAYDILLTDEDSRIGIEPGASYRISNLTLDTRVLATKEDYNKTTGIASSVASSEPLTQETDPYYQQWIFEEKNGSNVYALRNVSTGQYVDIVPNYQRNTVVPMSSSPHSYTKGAVSEKTGVFYLAPDNVTGSSLHMNNSGLIYHYIPSSDNTQWKITRLKTADYMALRDSLIAKIDSSMVLLNKAGKVVIPMTAKMPLTPTCLDSNSIQPSGNGAFTGWNSILDNNLNTYFASNRNTGLSTDGLDHYIKITAPDDETFRHFIFTYTNIGFASNAAYIRSYRIDASIDGEHWAPVYAANSGLNVTAGASNSSELITVPEGTKHIRFVVTKSDELKAFHYTFLLSNIQVDNTNETDCYPDSEYPHVSDYDMQEVEKKVAAANFAVKNPSTTAEDLKNHLLSLNSAYQNLEDKMSIETSVEVIGDSNESEENEYYGINGLRIKKPGNHEIIIRRQGKKITKELR